MVIQKPASLIEYRNRRFLIMECPRAETIDSLICTMEQIGAKDLVRVCEPTYEALPFQRANIRFSDIFYPADDAPSREIIQRWLEIVKQAWATDNAIAIHCIAGLGRAPFLVAIALIELAGLSANEAVALIRKARKGCISTRQKVFLESYSRPNHSNKLIKSARFVSQFLRSH